MKIITAEKKDFKNVKNITATTIESIYPHYYPRGAVDFFLSHHNDENIESDIESGIVYLVLMIIMQSEQLRSGKMKYAACLYFLSIREKASDGN